MSPIRIDAIALSKSPVSLTLGDEVPHIFTRKPRLRPLEFLILGAKRLLQHNLPVADSGRPGGSGVEPHTTTHCPSPEQSTLKWRARNETFPDERLCAKAIRTCHALAQLFELLLPRIFFFLILLEPLNRALHLGEQIVDGRIVVEETNLELRRILDEVLDVRARRARQWYAHRNMS
jgi:hypothetical protein